MKKLLISLVQIVVFSSSTLIAQVNNNISDNGLKDADRFKPKLTINSGVSIPYGKYTKLSYKSDDRSSAGTGVYADVEISFNPMLSSEWKTGLIIGYLYNPFQHEDAQTFFNLPILHSTDWNVGYALAGISYSTPTRYYVGLGVYAGIMGFLGGDILSGDIDNYGTWEVYEWNYKLKTALAIKGVVKTGYHINKKISIELQTNLFYSAGHRVGELNYESYLMFSNQILSSPSYNDQRITQNQTSIISLNIGLGFNYKFYKTSNQVNHNKFKFGNNG